MGCSSFKSRGKELTTNRSTKLSDVVGQRRRTLHYFAAHDEKGSLKATFVGLATFFNRRKQGRQDGKCLGGG